MLVEIQEKPLEESNLTAEKLIKRLAEKLIGKNVNKKGELYTIMNQFCLLRLNKKFEIFLTKTGNDIAEETNGLLSFKPAISVSA